MKTINKIRQILSPGSKITALLLVVSMSFGALLELLTLGMLMPLISAFVQPELFQTNKYLKYFYDLISPQNERQFIIIAAAILMLLYILKNIYNYIVFYFQSYFSMMLTLNITERVYKNSIMQPYAKIISADNSELINKIIRICDFGQQFLNPLLIALSEISVFIMLIATVFVITPMVGITAFIFSLTIAAIFYITARKKLAWHGKQEHLAKNSLLMFLSQSFAAIKELKLNHSEKYFRGRVSDAQKKNVWAMKHIFDWGNMPRMLLETTAVIIAMSILIILELTDVSSTKIIFTAAFFLAVMFRLLPSVSRLLYNLNLVKVNHYLFDLIYEILVYRPEADHECHDSEKLSFNRSLEIDKISFKYPNGNGQMVLKELSLTIKPLECIAVTGVSGCGKTTLIDIITGLLTPTEGIVKIDDIPLSSVREQWQKNIGYVPQETILFNATLKENIALGISKDKIDDSRIEEVLQLAHIDNFVNSLPNRANTVIGGADMRLSGGQKQRIAIARALYRNPQVLILDEATSALDNDTEKAFAESVDALKGKLTIIMIAHREKMISVCDREIRLC